MVNSKVNSRGVVGTNLDETSAAMDAAEYDEDGYRSSEDEVRERWSKEWTEMGRAQGRRYGADRRHGEPATTGL